MTLSIRRRYTGPDKTVRALIEARSGGRCEFEGCLRRAVHTHHRLPRRAGGSRDPRLNLPSNLVRLCAQDHAWVESNRADAYELGLLLRDGEDPEWVPAMTVHDPLPVFLLNDGSVSLFHGQGEDDPIWPAL